MFALDFLISPNESDIAVISRARGRTNEETRRYDSRAAGQYLSRVSATHTNVRIHLVLRTIDPSQLITGPLPVDLNIYRLKRLLRGRL